MKWMTDASEGCSPVNTCVGYDVIVVLSVMTSLLWLLLLYSACSFFVHQPSCLFIPFISFSYPPSFHPNLHFYPILFSRPQEQIRGKHGSATIQPAQTDAEGTTYRDEMPSQCQSQHQLLLRVGVSPQHNAV